MYNSVDQIITLGIRAGDLTDFDTTVQFLKQHSGQQQSVRTVQHRGNPRNDEDGGYDKEPQATQGDSIKKVLKSTLPAMATNIPVLQVCNPGVIRSELRCRSSRPILTYIFFRSRVCENHVTYQ